VLAPYCAHRADALVLDGPVIALTRNEAVLLSLLINEFATNATKYGAWSVPSGAISLTWRHEESIEPAEVHMIWQERGGPPVTEPTTSGFGTNVMKFSIERGLRGRIATTFAVEGIRHDVHFPRADATQEPEHEEPIETEE
jgi:two-component sensor histidine kinase